MSMIILHHRKSIMVQVSHSGSWAGPRKEEADAAGAWLPRAVVQLALAA